jgi:hypothetical protein
MGCGVASIAASAPAIHVPRIHADLGVSTCRNTNTNTKWGSQQAYQLREHGLECNRLFDVMTSGAFCKPAPVKLCSCTHDSPVCRISNSQRPLTCGNSTHSAVHRRAARALNAACLQSHRCGYQTRKHSLTAHGVRAHASTRVCFTCSPAATFIGFDTVDTLFLSNPHGHAHNRTSPQPPQTAFCATELCRLQVPQTQTKYRGGPPTGAGSSGFLRCVE